MPPPLPRQLLQEALLEIKRLRFEAAQAAEAATEPIAIVGMACRFPGDANTPEAYWQLLRDGADAIVEIPRERWDIDAYYDKNPEAPGKMYTRRGGFLRHIEQFDPEFFEISPKEASAMDPQQRLLLETAWETLEDAGEATDPLRGSNSGLFVGISFDDYAQWTQHPTDCAAVTAHSALGGARSIAVGRLAYFLGFQGPALHLDTTCSSSLVAIHLACQSLRSKECRLALAGGVNAILTPAATVAFCRMRALSPDGRCKTFDATADGYARGEGCGLVALKRLSDALADGNRILALVRGSAVNHDGRGNGLTAPNGLAQEAVIRASWESAGLQPSQAGYIETHGTGTNLGDPVEVAALAAATKSPDGGEILIGTVKTNFGHLESAAGIAGVLKVILALQHEAIPANLHFNSPNPLIPWAQNRFKVPTSLTSWPRGTTPRLAGVSSFGMSGTNAHLVIQEAPAPRPIAPAPARAAEVITVSAKNREALMALAARWASHFETSEDNLANLAFTANAGRVHLPHRLAFVAESKSAATNGLRSFAEGKPIRGLYASARISGAKKIAFLFTGQGSQRIGMGRHLYETESLFRDILQQCESALSGYFEKPLTEILYPKPGESSRLDDTAFAQPALFAIEVALASLWRSWGVEPEALFGHSIGEYAAACVAGVLELQEGLLLVAERARLMQTLPKNGAMASVFAPAARLEPWIAAHPAELSIAAINGPEMTVISGAHDVVDTVLAALKQEGIAAQKLAVSHAFHSPLIEPILDRFEEAAGRFPGRPLRLPIVSSLTGDWLPESAAPTASYRRRQIREPVRFASGIAALLEAGFTHFIECGPSPTLLALAQRCPPPASPAELFWLPSLKAGQDDWKTMLDTAARLHVSGIEIQWRRPHKNRRIVSLPTYPFERKSFWISTPKSRGEGVRTSPPQALWEAAAKAAGQRSESGFEGSTQTREEEKLAALNRLSEGYLRRALKKLGLLDGSGNLDRSALENSPIVPRFRKAILGWARRGLIAADLAKPAPHQTALWEAVATLWNEEADLPQLARQCGQELDRVLRGEVDPLTIIFPKGSSARMERIYADSAWAKYCNGTMAAAVQAACGATEGKPIGILEIGAGTGATTRYLLPILANTNARYTFTDVGPSFLQTAQEKFSNFPFVDYKLLDLEKDPRAQGFEPESFDLVVVANVLHLARNLKTAARRIQSLLKPGGLLLLWEATVQQPWMDLVFSTLEGWQGFDDLDLRPNHPLLTANAWIDLLQHHGFEEARAFPESSDDQRPGIGQQVILARAGGNAAPQKAPSLEIRETTAITADPGLTYTVRWQRHPQAPARPEAAGVHWLIFADRTGFADSFAATVREHCGRSTLIRSGEGFEKIEDNIYQASPASADLDKVLHAILDLAPPPSPMAILFLWTLDHASDNRSLAQIQTLACDAPIFILQALLRKNPTPPPRLWLVTRGSQPAENQVAAAAADQALLWGLGKTIAVEHPQLWGGLIDLDPGRPADETETLWQFLGNPEGEDQAALRENKILVPRLARHTPGAGKIAPIVCDPNGTYLIFGGLGGIGLEAARWLVKLGARRLALLGRTSLPPRSHWFARKSEDPSVASKIDAILQLETLGVSVVAPQCDLSHETELQEFLKREREEARPPIRGVIHSAGSVEETPLASLTQDAFQRLLRAKVAGTWNLYRALRHEKLDFLFLYSSAAALFGSHASAAYTAANAFLDAWAHYLRGQGLPACAINWGPWDEIGMAGAEERGKRLGARGLLSLKPEAAFRAAESARHTAEITVMSVQWDRFLEENARISRMRLIEEFQKHSAAPNAAPALNAAASRLSPTGANAAPNTSDGVFVVRATAELLGIDAARVDLERPLNTLGLDSIMAVQLRNELELKFRVTLGIREIVESTAAQLIARIREHLEAA